jgi:HD-like signal output (HDOD) protein/ActR/RegA family two-component response regulator
MSEQMPLEATNTCCADEPLTGVSTQPIVINVPTPAKTRILFVDDEPSMLRVLKIGMRSMAASWEMDFAGGGAEGLALVQQKEFDVVVTDMRMADINGAQLLNHVLRNHPQTVRIVLSGYSDLSEVVSCVGLTHQFLEKPCSLDELKDCLKRVTAVKTGLTNQKIFELAAGLKNLPSLPELYLEIADALQSPNSSAQRIADIACKDPAIAAKLLQLSNSAFFGFSHKVFSVTEAVQLLGVGVIQSVAMAVPIFSAFSRNKCPNFPIDQIWEHSVQTGALGQRLAGQLLNDSYLSEQAFCAGMLHDLGKLILADGLPQEYAAVIQESLETKRPLFEVEREHFQATHAELGAYLLALWGLPIPLVEAVANHHQPRRCGTHELCLAGVLHVANVLEHAQSANSHIVAQPVDADYLKAVGLGEQFESWRAEWSAIAANAESAC